MAEWSFPAPVEAARLSDELLGEAYEQTPASSRGWLKTTLAMTEALHGARPSARTVQTCNPAAGFEITSTAAMAPWALFLLGTHGASASRLASAIMTARLAGLEDIFAVCLAIPERPALLTALELTGVEQVFHARTRDILATLLQTLNAGSSATGRVLCFGDLPPETIPALPPEICLHDQAPQIAVLAEAVSAEATILKAHPDAQKATDPRSRTAVFGTEALSTTRISPAAPHTLYLSSALVGAWVNPALTPDWFMNTSTRIVPLSPPLPSDSGLL